MRAARWCGRLAGAVLLLAACSDDTTSTPADAAIADGAAADSTVDSTPLGAEGDPCKAGDECASGICFAKACATACSDNSGCAKDQDCVSDDGKRMLCKTRTYADDIGQFCGIDGTCTGKATQCIGGKGYGSAYCTATCATDLDCPSRYYCRELSDKKKYCVTRAYCGRCHHDDMCPAGHSCVKHGKQKHCLKVCTKGSTECPRFAECKDSGDGKTYVCHHKAGRCVGDASMCDPCITGEDCDKDAYCLTFTATKEQFCSKNCATNKCAGQGTALKCQSFKGSSQCLPGSPGGNQLPHCVGSLSNMMQPGDIFDDFVFVGYRDSDKNGSLAGEKLRRIRLSDFASTHKVILFNIAAGWCGPCKAEAATFATLMKKYEASGLMIVSVLVDNIKPGQRPTVSFLDSWIGSYGPNGAVGIDPPRVASQYNNTGKIPYNVILDGKTRKVLEAFSSASGLESKLKGYLGL